MLIVIKVGTNVLTGPDGQVSRSRIERIAGEIFDVWKKGHKIILVTSGAIGTGRARLPELAGIASKQVWAAVGQPELMQIYTKYLGAKGLMIGQCLLLRDDFTDRERYENSIRTIQGLLDAGVLPVINENDVVAMEDLTVGDNDLLAAMLAVAIKADKLILLTNQKGLYTANPDIDKGAKLIETVANVDRQFEKMFSSETSSLGRGGMLSKVRAAKHAVHAGVATYIADGRQEGIISKIIEDEKVGTKFAATNTHAMSQQQRWLMSTKGFGQVIIDDGAAKALQTGKSLLFPGVFAAKGMFEKGQIVEVISKRGQPVAYGKINYSYKNIQKAFEERKTTGKKNPLDKEVIHRDYMVVLST